MASVDADPYPTLILYQRDDATQMAELKAKVATLTSCILYDSRNALCGLERTVDALGNKLEALVLGNLLKMTAWVEIEQGETQNLTAVHLVGEGVLRLKALLGVGVTQIDKVTIVGQNLCRSETTLVTGCLKLANFCGFELLGRPLPLVLGEEGKSRCANGLGIDWGIENTARCTYVSTYIFGHDSENVLNKNDVGCKTIIANLAKLMLLGTRRRREKRRPHKYRNKRI